MLESIDFNTLINHIVFTMDSLLVNKDYPPKLRDYLYLIATGMILSYGDEYLEEIYKLLTTIKFTDEKEIDNYSNNGYKLLSYVNPTNHNYLSKLFDYSSTFPTINYNYVLIFKEINSSKIKTLEYLVHELNYILFNMNKKYSFMNSIKIRYNYLKNDLDVGDDKVNTFKRVLNVLQSEDIIKRVLELRNYEIKNVKFRNALSNFDNIDLDNYRFEGLDMLVNLFRPLYRFKDTKYFIDKSMFCDSDLIENEFDKVLGKNSYKNLCVKLDFLNDSINNSGKEMNSYYYLSLDYLDIRNNFVKRYIDIKYLNKA
ncbi:MAG: hypothetical protein ACI4XM_01865 [Candidatus Coprovivens sp.]